MIGLQRQQLRDLGTRGYVVVPNVVPADLVAAAMERIDGLVADEPPPADRRGFHFYWCDEPEPDDPLLTALTRSPAFDIAQSLIAPRVLAVPRQVQVSLNLPPWRHRPGGPHLDGISVREPDGRPGTFTMLAGILLTDQSLPDMGNLWAWPGSHELFAAHLRRAGPQALVEMEHPQMKLAPPEQITGKAGDLLLAHYLLGHNMGGNLSETVRRVVYYRLKSETHAAEWQACVQDPLREFAPVRQALEVG